MDKNSVIGLLLIGSILVGWMFLSKPSAEEIAKRKQQQDSILKYENKKLDETLKANSSKSTSAASANNGVPSKADSAVVLTDSAKHAIANSTYHDFLDASKGENKIITIENELMKVNLSTKGGRISSVELKNYKTFDKKPLILFDADSSTQALSFGAYGKPFSTDSLYFTSDDNGFSVKDKESKSITMRMYAGSKAKYIEYIYTLTGNEYMMGCRINIVGLQDIVEQNTSYFTLNWQMKTPTQEQNKSNQLRASTVYYKYLDDDVDKISESAEEKKALESKVKWV